MTSLNPESTYGSSVLPWDVLRVAKLYDVPMSLVDGRPWVPTEVEADPGDEVHG